MNSEFEDRIARDEYYKNLTLYEEYRQTIQPSQEWDDDDLDTKRRLTCSLWY